MCKLPRGYSLTWLPSNAKIISDVTDKPGEIELCSSYNIPKAIVAIVQTIFASITLYRTRGDQIQRYGYAAFGLTVLPYLIMSIMNLFATLILPDYSKLYVVRSLELDEAMTVGSQVEGAIGRIVQSSTENDNSFQGMSNLDDYIGTRQRTDQTASNFDYVAPKSHILSITHAHCKRNVACCGPINLETLGVRRWSSSWKFICMEIVSLVLGAVPIAVIGIWTHFDPGESTVAQRVWILFWLVEGIGAGPILDVVSERGNFFEIEIPEKDVALEATNQSTQNRWKASILRLLFSSCLLAEKYFVSASTHIYIVPAIGGFVVVGQMLHAYGECNEVSGLVT